MVEPTLSQHLIEWAQGVNRPEFRKHLLEAAAALEWQDISTAPKDGTRIVLFGVPHGSYYVREKRYWAFGAVGPKEVGEGYFYGSLWQRNGGTWENPTHWQPLPNPPEDGGKQ